MGLNFGIVGLPNVGKSTLFNALTRSSAAAVANYPFCTIEPNVGTTFVRDDRLKTLASMANSKKVLFSSIEFVDIAGLVKGASGGEGLGNKFLGHIREVDAIMHVLRCFEDSDISHVNHTVDPVHDAEIVEMELMLADMESVQRQIITTEKAVKSRKESQSKLDTLVKVLATLESGKPVRSLHKNEDIDQGMLKQLHLLSSKPVMYVCNVEDINAAIGNGLSSIVQEMAVKHDARCCHLSAKLEADILALDTEEVRSDFFEEVGLKQSGIDTAVQSMYKLLNLITFFTVGPNEARAWPILTNTPAYKAAGVIHTDFEKGFIRAEAISFCDFVEYLGESGCREAGRVRLEGRDYLVQDGDILHFRVSR